MTTKQAAPRHLYKLNTFNTIISTKTGSVSRIIRRIRRWQNLLNTQHLNNTFVRCDSYENQKLTCLVVVYAGDIYYFLIFKKK